VQTRALEAVPILSMVSKAACSKGGCVLDAFCSFLTPSMVEARICAQDWLRSAPLSLSIEDLEEHEVFDFSKNIYIYIFIEYLNPFILQRIL